MPYTGFYTSSIGRLGVLKWIFIQYRSPRYPIQDRMPYDAAPHYYFFVLAGVFTEVAYGPQKTTFFGRITLPVVEITYAYPI